MELTRADYDGIRDFLHRTCGFFLSGDKEYLVRQRLEPVIAGHGLSGYRDLCTLLRQGAHPGLAEDVIAAVATHETSFFRDVHPFAAFRDHILPEVTKKIALGGRVRIWSAACSTGQEPYSLAMQLQALVLAGKARATDFTIHATDISRRALERASLGVYTAGEMARNVPSSYKDRFFEVQGDTWRVQDEVRPLIHFAQRNLMEPFDFPAPFDVIFCRNVLIYFDAETKRDLLTRFAAMLVPGGFLVLGASENTYTLSEDFEAEYFGQTILYRRVGD